MPTILSPEIISCHDHTGYLPPPSLFFRYRRHYVHFACCRRRRHLPAINPWFFDMSSYFPCLLLSSGHTSGSVSMPVFARYYCHAIPLSSSPSFFLYFSDFSPIHYPDYLGHYLHSHSRLFDFLHFSFPSISAFFQISSPSSDDLRLRLRRLPARLSPPSFTARQRQPVFAQHRGQAREAAVRRSSSATVPQGRPMAARW